MYSVQHESIPTKQLEQVCKIQHSLTKFVSFPLIKTLRYLCICTKAYQPYWHSSAGVIKQQGLENEVTLCSHRPPPPAHPPSSSQSWLMLSPHHPFILSGQSELPLKAGTPTLSSCLRCSVWPTMTDDSTPQVGKKKKKKVTTGRSASTYGLRSRSRTKAPPSVHFLQFVSHLSWAHQEY